MGAYPRDAVGWEEAANKHGVVQLAARYGYSEKKTKNISNTSQTTRRRKVFQSSTYDDDDDDDDDDNETSWLESSSYSTQPRVTRKMRPAMESLGELRTSSNSIQPIQSSNEKTARASLSKRSQHHHDDGRSSSSKRKNKVDPSDLASVLSSTNRPTTRRTIRPAMERLRELKKEDEDSS